MQDVLQIERETRKFRLLSLLLVAIGLLAQRGEVPLLPAIALSLSYLAYLSVFLFAIVRRVSRRWLPYVMLSVDTAFVAGMLSVFGVNSPAFILLPMLVVYYALYLGYGGTFISATLVTSTYIGLAFVQDADLALGRALPMQVPLLYLLALFSCGAAQQRHRVQREKEDLSLLLQAERGARAALQATAGLSSVLDTTALSHRLAELAAIGADCQCVRVRVIDPASGILGPAATFVNCHQPDEGTAKCCLDDASAVELDALERGKALEFSDLSAEYQKDWAALSLSFIRIVPLVADGDAVGTLLLLDSTPRRRLSTAQLQLIDNLAAFFARIIRYSSGFATAQRETARTSSELRSTVRQIARRQQVRHWSDLRVGDLLLVPARQYAALGDKSLDLSAREFAILYLLARHAGQPVDQEVMLREVWGDGAPTRSNVVDVAINRLRHKLDERAAAGAAIRTLRGSGYLLDRLNLVLKNGSGSNQDANHQSHRSQRGSLILEHVISLAIVAILVPALLAALSGVINHAFEYGDRTQILELAQSQMESVKKQSFQASPADYGLISPVPQDYSISLVTSEAQRYVYANGAAAPEVLQTITVTVTGYNGSLTVTGYRYRE